MWQIQARGVAIAWLGGAMPPAAPPPPPPPPPPPAPDTTPVGPVARKWSVRGAGNAFVWMPVRREEPQQDVTQGGGGKRRQVARLPSVAPAPRGSASMWRQDQDDALLAVVVPMLRRREAGATIRDQDDRATGRMVAYEYRSPDGLIRLRAPGAITRTAR